MNSYTALPPDVRASTKFQGLEAVMVARELATISVGVKPGTRAGFAFTIWFPDEAGSFLWGREELRRWWFRLGETHWEFVTSELLADVTGRLNPPVAALVIEEA